jgi:DNA mismatch repair protein MutL
MKIRILSEEIASRIAAGEVVERPASVVKELIENSLDAGATEVAVWVEKSGAALIRVTDDGDGMTAEDLALAVERHSTSKLQDEKDLGRIATLGFRGEALPSIASVSKLEIISRPGSSSVGHRLRAAGGRKDEPCVTGSPVGTTVEIREIFFNTPARRKFLKAPATELSHICDVVNRMALAYPNVHFRLAHDARVIADYVGVPDTKDRLFQVLGREIAQKLIPFARSEDAVTIKGYLSTAPVSFPNSRYLITFVNGRYVRDKVLTHAVMHGYETLLMKGQYPAVVLFLDLPFDEVDVNVHPAKHEVRFRHQAEIHEAAARAVRQALKLEAKEPAGPRSSASKVPRAWVGVMESPLPYAGSAVRSEQLARPMESAFPVPSLADSMGQGFFASMNVLGQILGCYLVCSSSRGLAIIDQHAAHERVTFEKLRSQIETGGVHKQSLLLPQILDLSAGEVMLMEKMIPPLDRLGFVVETFGANAYAITSVPALLPEGDYRQVVRQMVAELAEVDRSEKLRQHLEERLATIACHSVIRANRKLEGDEIRALLQELDQVDFATQCPHGRPVLFEWGRDELDKMFKRI